MKRTSSQRPECRWILLLYSLPTKRGAARLSLWRKLRKAGALALKTSAYVLPDEPAHYEKFQWLAQQVRDAGGEATLIRATEIEGLTHEQIVRLFQQQREEGYKELVAELNAFLHTHRRKPGEDFDADLERLKAKFEEVRRIDFFACPRAEDVQMLLHRAMGLRQSSAPPPRLSAKKFRGKVWVTRPRPGIDRCGSAWLITRFIDSQARFVFANDPAVHPEAIPYDMMGVEFSHQGEGCTFETLARRFAIDDRAVCRMAEMVHDADLEDGKFQRPECSGLNLVLRGWERSGADDEQLLSRGIDLFQALYESLR